MWSYSCRCTLRTLHPATYHCYQHHLLTWLYPAPQPPPINGQFLDWNNDDWCTRQINCLYLETPPHRSFDTNRKKYKQSAYNTVFKEIFRLAKLIWRRKQRQIVKLVSISICCKYSSFLQTDFLVQLWHPVLFCTHTRDYNQNLRLEHIRTQHFDNKLFQTYSWNQLDRSTQEN